MSEQIATTFSNKLSILAEFWVNYRGDEDFNDFMEYNDIGLPVAYALNEGIVKSTDIAEKFVNETFELLLAGLDIEDTGYETIDEVLEAADQ